MNVKTWPYMIISYNLYFKILWPGICVNLKQEVLDFITKGCIYLSSKFRHCISWRYINNFT